MKTQNRMGKLAYISTAQINEASWVAVLVSHKCQNEANNGHKQGRYMKRSVYLHMWVSTLPLVQSLHKHLTVSCFIISTYVIPKSGSLWARETCPNI